MRRFKVSKYKNAAPKSGKNDPWIRDLSIGSYACSGSFIKASAAYTAFNINPTGSQLGIAPLDSSNVSILNAHSDLVTDFDFSPFEDNLLATASGDSTVKVWSLDKNKTDDLSTLSPELISSSKLRRVESVLFNPTTEYLLLYSSQNTLTFLDILHNKEVCYLDELHGDTVMSLDWSYNGNLVATTCKDKKVRILDPRGNTVSHCAISHDNPKDSRILWCGDSGHILTTGFDSSRMRQIFVRDTRMFGEPVANLSFDSSTGILIPMFDHDTNMVFIAGRGDCSISYYEFSTSQPWLSEGHRYTGEQTKGACLAPKRALRVMETEVNRIYQLCSNSVYSISYYVPRKTYIDFHEDLYPNTRGTSTTGYVSLWMDGSNGIVSKISLNPSTNKSTGDCVANGLVVFKKSLSSRKQEDEEKTQSLREPSEGFRKPVPEPLPRKKSLTPSGSGSSTEDVSDVGTSSRPVPRPRVSNLAGTSSITALRTPSSFFPPRRGADFSSYGSSSEDSLPPNSVVAEIVRSANSFNNNEGQSEIIDTSLEVSSQNGTSLTSTDEQVINNGNGVKASEEDPEDTQVLSTSDRRRQFETRTESVPEAHSSNADLASQEDKKVRLSVADRLKLFQRNCSVEAESLGTGAEKQREDEVKNNKSKEEPTKVNETPSHQPPFAKPERKITPPSKANEPQQPAKTHKRIETVFGQVSKFRNFKALPVHKKFHIENLRNISTTCPSESELIQANPERVAVPLNTPGGKLAIFELSKPGRLADGVIPALVHGVKVGCFDWDPFDNHHLVVGCDDGKICGWKIPSKGLKEQTNEPEYSFFGHAEKLYFVKFHPLAKDVLASGSYDLSIRIWDLCKREDLILVHLQPEIIQMFSFAWSPSGSKFCIASKDGMLRIFEPRETSSPIVEGKGPQGVRGGRVTWVLDGKCIVVAGFDRSSERQVIMYRSDNFEQLCNVALDVSPSILVPFYDEDSSLLLLSGRGDSTIYSFDVIDENPYLRQLSPHRCAGAHQGISFLKKNALDVKGVEFARCLRLTESAVEPWSFTVPRVKSEFFQDDLFPETKLLWEPTMTAEEWFEGKNAPAKKVSLKPADMKSVAEVSGKYKNDKGTRPKPKEKEIVSTGPIRELSDKEKQKNIEESLKSKMPLNMALEQDTFEGVSEDEWNSN